MLQDLDANANSSTTAPVTETLRTFGQVKQHGSSVEPRNSHTPGRTPSTILNQKYISNGSQNYPTIIFT